VKEQIIKDWQSTFGLRKFQSYKVYDELISLLEKKNEKEINLQWET